VGSGKQWKAAGCRHAATAGPAAISCHRLAARQVVGLWCVAEVWDGLHFRPDLMQPELRNVAREVVKVRAVL
jgi:hypothetical protein